MDGEGGCRTPVRALLGLGLGRERARRRPMSYLCAGPMACGMRTRSYSTRILHTRAPPTDEARTLLSYACREAVHARMQVR